MSPGYAGSSLPSTWAAQELHHHHADLHQVLAAEASALGAAFIHREDFLQRSLQDGDDFPPALTVDVEWRSAEVIVRRLVEFPRDEGSADLFGDQAEEAARFYTGAIDEAKLLEAASS